MMELWPFTNFHDLNLDWIIKKIRSVEDSEAAAKASEEAAANSATSASTAVGMALFYQNKAKDYRDEAQGFANDAQDSAESIEGVVDQVNTNTNRISEIIANAGDGTIPSELVDIRVAWNGVTYSTAGDAVRAESKNNADSISAMASGEFVELPVVWHNNSYIDADGVLTANNQYKYSDPVKVCKNTTVKLESAYYSFAAISLTDATASSYTPLIYADITSAAVKTYYYTATEDCYLAFSGFKNNSTTVSYTYSLKRIYDTDIVEFTPNEWYSGYIDFDGQLVSSSSYRHTPPIKLLARQKIKVYAANYLYSVISLTDAQGSYYTPVVLAESGTPNVNAEYEYYASEDCYVIACGQYTSSVTPEIYTGYDDLVTMTDLENIPKDYCGINVFPFRTVTGRTETLYKESIIAGDHPIENFEIIPSIRSTNLNNYALEVITFNKDTAGTYPITIRARDAKLDLTEKTVNVEVVTAPQEKLVNFTECKVCFIGDSLIWNNDNLIGAEYARMLNTNDQSTTISGNSVELPTLYAARGKIHLYGETLGDNNAPFTMAESSHVICTGTRTSEPGEGTMRENPFYNPDSSEPDELGADGINKRVDFGWWFDNVIGQGENPDIIYLATSPNDYANTYGWDLSAVPTVVDNMIAICKKIKATCNSRANGYSNTIIKLIQHQPYQYSSNGFNFPVVMQRVLWYETAKQFYERLQSEGMTTYTEIIPAASRFDIETGYNKTPRKLNDRSTEYNGTFISGGSIHMNTTGAYNYADVLVYDFMADSRFD